VHLNAMLEEETQIFVGAASDRVCEEVEVDVVVAKRV
jgi:hypothetical protein